MSLADAYWAAPPVTRTITAVAVAISVPGHLGFYNLLYVLFLSDYVFTLQQIPQIWRLVTCFFVTGPKLSMIFDPFFLYHYSSQLEVGSPRFSGPGSYFFYLVFVGLIILPTAGMYLGAFSLLGALTMAITYTFAQDDPNRQTMFFIIQMPAKYVPFASLVITFLMAGPAATMQQATGILAAHAYEFLDRIWPQYGGGQSWIKTPQFVQNWFAGPAGTGQRRSHGTAFAGRSDGPRPQAAPQRQTGSGGGFASGFNSGTFGAGRRLGGD